MLFMNIVQTVIHIRTPPKTVPLKQHKYANTVPVVMQARIIRNVTNVRHGHTARTTAPKLTTMQSLYAKNVRVNSISRKIMLFALIAVIPITPMRIIRYAVTAINSTRSRKINARSYANSATLWSTHPTSIRDAVTVMSRVTPRKIILNARSAAKSMVSRTITVPTSRKLPKIQTTMMIPATFADLIIRLRIIPCATIAVTSI